MCIVCYSSSVLRSGCYVLHIGREWLILWFYLIESVNDCTQNYITKCETDKINLCNKISTH